MRSRCFIGPPCGALGIYLRVVSLALFVTALVAVALPLRAAAGERESLAQQLVGTWSFVSSIARRGDGSTIDRWGPDAKGMFIFDDKGHFSQMITRPESRVFGAKMVASFGTYTIDDANQAFVAQIEGSSSPKLNGLAQRRSIVSVNGDELRYVFQSLSTDLTVEAVWKRIK